VRFYKALHFTNFLFISEVEGQWLF